MPPGNDASARSDRRLPSAASTVTGILEAYAGEAVEVVKLSQEFEVAGETGAELDVPPDDKVLRRRVLLRGATSGRTFVHAEAVVALARAAPQLVDGLLGTEKPIGILLVEQGIVASKEMLHVHREPAGSNAAHFGLAPTAELVSRTYRMVDRHQPLILITEKLPPRIFRRVSS